MATVEGAGQVQFRKASREFGERKKREAAAGAVRVAHTGRIYFLYARHLTAHAAYRSVDGIRIARVARPEVRRRGVLSRNAGLQGGANAPRRGRDRITP